MFTKPDSINIWKGRYFSRKDASGCLSGLFRVVPYMFYTCNSATDSLVDLFKPVLVLLLLSFVRRIVIVLLTKLELIARELLYNC